MHNYRFIDTMYMITLTFIYRKKYINDENNQVI